MCFSRTSNSTWIIRIPAGLFCARVQPFGASARMGPEEERESKSAWFFASCDLRNLETAAIRGALQLYAQTAVLPDSYKRRVMDREAADQLARELDFQVRAQKIRFERIQESAPSVRVENELPFEPPPTTSEDPLRGPPRDRHLRVRLLGENEPRATKWYVLKLDDGSQREGRTSSHGLLIEKLPASVRRVKLQVGSSDLGFDEHVIDLDVLEQISQLGGLKQRLQNAGLLTGAPGRQLDDATREAVARFQERHKLKVTGELDKEMREKLEEVHGS